MRFFVHSTRSLIIEASTKEAQEISTNTDEVMNRHNEARSLWFTTHRS